MHAARLVMVLLYLAPALASAADDPSPAPSAQSTPLPASSAQIAPLPASSAQIAPLPASSAQIAPLPAPSGPPGFDPGLMRRMQAQIQRASALMRESQIAMRRDVLGALTSAQRSTVASIVGELAIAPDPDVAAATRRIDAVLSPAQRQAIVGIISAQALRRQAMFYNMLGHQNEMMAQVYGGAAQRQPPAVEHPMPQTSGSLQVQTGTGFAIPFPAPALPLGMQPNQTAGTMILGVLVSPGLMAVQPLPMIINGSLLPSRIGPPGRLR